MSVPKHPIDIEAALRHRGLSLAAVGRKHGISRQTMCICVNYADRVRAAIEAALAETNDTEAA